LTGSVFKTMHVTIVFHFPKGFLTLAIGDLVALLCLATVREIMHPNFVVPIEYVTYKLMEIGF
jgi:hypothetical protein